MAKLDDITNNEFRHDSRLKGFLRNTLLFGSMAIGSIFASQEAIAQYNVNIHARSLDKTANGTPISGMVISKDGGDVVEVTNANGDAVMSNVGGSMSIKISHPDYMQFTQTLDIHSDTTLWVATPALNDSRWLGNILDIDNYKALFQTANGNHDPAQWKNFPSKINIQYVNFSQADSAKATTFFTQLKTMTGYDLFNVTTGNKDTMYTVYTNSNTYVSSISTDINRLIFAGYSKLMNISYVKYFGHEVIEALDIAAMVEPAKYPSIGDPDIATMTDLNQTDAHHIGVTFDQHFRKYSGKQVLFLGNMQNYVALGNVSSTLISNPANNSTGNDTIVNILFNKDSNATYYDYKITTDAAGNTILLQGTLDRPKVTADLEPNKDYYVFARARNATSTGTWTSNKFKTKANIIMPGNTSITTPITGATNVNTPVQYTLTSSSNATLYEIIIATDANFTNIAKDTVVNNINPTIPLNKGVVYYTKASGKNSNGNGPWTSTTTFTTKTDPIIPGATSITTPTNGATGVNVPVTYTLTAASNATLYEIIIATDANFTNIAKDTIVNNTTPSVPLQKGTVYYTKASGKNSNGNGPWTSTTTFTTKTDPIMPGNTNTTSPIDGSAKQPSTSITTWTQSANATKYNLEVALDRAFTSMIIDSTLNGINTLNATIKLPAGKTVYERVRGENSNGNGNWSPTITYTIQKDKPGNSAITNPIDGATEIPQQLTITSTLATNGENYEYRIFQGTTLVKDSTVNTPNMTYNLPGNRTFTFTARAKNSDQNGEWSSIVTAKTYNDAPTITATNPSATDKIKVTEDLAFAALAYDKNNDPITGSLEIKNNEQDTIIYNLTPDNAGKINYILKKESNFLKPQKTYNYIFTTSDGTKSSTATGQFSTLGTGIENLVDKSGIKIYPTIGSEYINIECNPIKPVTYNTEIFDMNGRLIYHNNDKIYGTEIKDRIDVSSFKNGMYVLLVTLNNETKPQKIIIQK